MPENHVLLETIQLNQSAASVTFDNIPQTGYTDLKIVYSGRDTTDSPGSVYIQFNGAGYNSTTLKINGTGSSVSSSSHNNAYLGLVPGPSQTANTFSNGEIYIPNYTSSTNKSFSSDVVNENNATAAAQFLWAGLWANTAAITSVTLKTDQAFAQYSTFSLYGIAAVGSTPAFAPFATGGDIVANDGTYWYHAFLTSGFFTPQLPLSCDALVIAGGGGGGGGYYAGGGGGGGLLSFTSQTVTTTSIVAIGAGGASSTRGGNSQFASLTASVGGGAGGFQNTAGGNGGSGGGAASVGGGAALSGGTGTSGQGTNGGNGFNRYEGVGSGGGGGGKSTAGANATQSNGGAGGNGSSSFSSYGVATGTGQNISGTCWYAGGGGGGGASSGGAGGSGGGATGIGGFSQVDGIPATANTGGGGGGANMGDPVRPGGKGGSGIVIIRYAM